MFDPGNPDQNEEMDRQALLGQMKGGGGNTGVTGYGMPGGVQAPPIAPPAPEVAAGGSSAAAPAAPAQKYGLGGGFNMDKVNDPNHQSAKYQIARVMQDFDPTKGVTPELVAALNSRTGGKFHGEGDKLYADKGFDNLNDGTALDVVQGLKGGNGQWQYADMADAQGGGAPAPMGAGGGMNNAEGLLGPSLVSSSPDFFKQLLAKLQGSLDGPATVDDNALRQLL